MVKGVENGESMSHMNPGAEESMSVASSSDDSAAAAAVFRHLGNSMCYSLSNNISFCFFSN